MQSHSAAAEPEQLARLEFFARQSADEHHHRPEQKHGHDHFSEVSQLAFEPLVADAVGDEIGQRQRGNNHQQEPTWADGQFLGSAVQQRPGSYHRQQRRPASADRGRWCFGLLRR